jgi:Transposase DDE domain
LDRFQKYLKDCGLPPVSNNTASYCEARQRLPEEVVWELARRSGQSIHDKADTQWLFAGRPVKLLDCATVIMPDTEANQAEYPQSRSQKSGLGFPIARILLVISLAVGTVLEAAMGPHRGKETSELGLLRQISGALKPGDIALGDRHFCSYWVIADSLRRGVDVVLRLHQMRKTDFRRGRRLGPDDHIVTWPKAQRPDWMSPAEYAKMPKELKLREIRVRIKDRKKRTREIVIVTTLLDATKYSASAIGDLFRQRWHAEVCQADCVSRYTLYQARGSAHSKRYSVVGAGTMEPDTPAIEPRRTAMRRLNVRLGAPPTQTVMVALSA